MLETITVNGKELKFKSSAATNILYKRAFKQDVMIELSSYSKNVKELKEIKEKVRALKADETKTAEDIATEMSNLMQSDVFEKISAFSNNILPKLEYIMHVEAEYTEKDIFGKLNEEDYLVWLLGIDADTLTNMTGRVLEIWKNGAGNLSKAKN